MLGWLSLQVQALSHTLTREVPTLATLPTVSGTLISLSLSLLLSLPHTGMVWHGMARHGSAASILYPNQGSADET